MKTATLLNIVTFLTGTLGFLIKVPTQPVTTQPVIAPVRWIHLQKLILPLFENVCEDSINPTIVRLAQEFNVESSNGIYMKPEVIVNLKNLITGKNLLPKGEIFIEYNDDHINELRTIYEVFFYAKDFDTFYKAAAWSRQNVNCGLFVDAIYLAMLNRRDTEHLTLPAPYELLPNYFIRKDVIVKASSLLTGEAITPPDDVRVEGNAYILNANYTATLYDNDHESKLSYFYEDIGLNCYYFLQKVKMAPWFNTPPDSNIGYGEYLYHMMKQLSTRYDLERYSNGLPEVEVINWDTFTVTPYDPILIYTNGNEFGRRGMTKMLSGNSELELLQNIEYNIATVVTHMRDSGFNKTQVLNHLMEILVTGIKNYETVARRMTGKNLSDNGQPTVLSHYITSLRDPFFWRLNKKIVNIIDEALKHIPVYTKQELLFPGIEILNIEMKKTMTMFANFQFDVTDALKSDTNNVAFEVKVEQARLNHKPFALKLNISSFVSQKGLVKIYLGPKVAPGQFASKKNLFMLLDNFEHNFKMGINVISRTSDQIANLSDDFAFLKTLRKKVEDAEFGINILPLKSVQTMAGFPSRLLLPKGTPEGIPLQILAFVAPFVKTTLGGPYALTGTDLNTAILSPGYPFDLDIEGLQLFALPNLLVKDIVVTHKEDPKLSNYGGSAASKKWQGGKSYDPSSRPDYSAIRKEPFDYSSKRGQYGKQEDYSANGGEYYKGRETVVVDQNEKIGTMNIENEKTIQKGIINKGTDKYSDKDSEELPVSIQKDNDETWYRENMIPLLKLTAPGHRLSSIFDYLLPQYNYDDDMDERVYE